MWSHRGAGTSEKRPFIVGETVFAAHRARPAHRFRHGDSEEAHRRGRDVAPQFRTATSGGERGSLCGQWRISPSHSDCVTRRDPAVDGPALGLVGGVSGALLGSTEQSTYSVAIAGDVSPVGEKTRLAASSGGGARPRVRIATIVRRRSRIAGSSTSEMSVRACSLVRSS